MISPLSGRQGAGYFFVSFNLWKGDGKNCFCKVMASKMVHITCCLKLRRARIAQNGARKFRRKFIFDCV